MGKARATKPRELKPEVDLVRMTKAAYRVCQRRGYNPGDSEYGSAINEAVWQASKEWNSTLKCSPTTLASIKALRLCKRVSQRLAKDAERLTKAVEVRSKPRSIPEPLNLPRVDSELLAFVATYGKQQAAKLLQVKASWLRERLDRIQARVLQLVTTD